MFKRILSMIHARNLEFVRDRSSLGWNFMMPLFLVFGLAFTFSGGQQAMFKVAVIGDQSGSVLPQNDFYQMSQIDFYFTDAFDKTLEKVSRHQVDMLIRLPTDEAKATEYWMNPQSDSSEVVAKLLEASGQQLAPNQTDNQTISYVDWVIPGILGMNMMFSALFGVGYVIVRYRKSGYLKRLNATPLRPFEFIISQLVSRLLIIFLTTALLFVAAEELLGFAMNGSYLLLSVIALLGGMSLIALSLMMTAMVSSEELAGGLLNLVVWPMMLLSGVWFSLEGTNQWVQYSAEIFPLTHMLEAVRAITIDGASLVDVLKEIVVLSGMTLVFVIVGSYLFKWNAN